MTVVKKLVPTLLLGLLICLFSSSAFAETYNFQMKTTFTDGKESAVLTAKDTAGNVKWTYYSDSYPAAELSAFSLILNDHGGIFVVENGTIKAFDYYTGSIKWENPDFKGSPAKDCYAFSSSDKLYIAGYYGPDLFVVDADGKTVCRADSLVSGSYWADEIYFSGGDNMTIHYASDDRSFTFNVLDYFDRRDSLAADIAAGYSSVDDYTPEQLAAMAQAYYERHYGYFPPEAEVADHGDGTWTIHLYAFVTNEFAHMSTYAWYHVDSHGVGREAIMGEEIDLRN